MRIDNGKIESALKVYRHFLRLRLLTTSDAGAAHLLAYSDMHLCFTFDGEEREELYARMQKERAAA